MNGAPRWAGRTCPRKYVSRRISYQLGSPVECLEIEKVQDSAEFWSRIIIGRVLGHKPHQMGEFL